MNEAAMRARIIELLEKASRKEAELHDGMSAAEIESVERAHGAICDEIDELRRQLNQKGTSPMPDGIDTDATPNNASAAVRAERERVREINAIARAGDIGGALVEDAIEDGATVEAFRKIVLDLLAERSQAGAGTGARTEGSRVIVLRDGGETRRRGMTDALTARLAMAGGDRRVEVPAHARAYAGMGLAEMAAECIGHRGPLRTAAQATDVFARAMHTVSDFPAIFMEGMGRRLATRYQLAQPTYTLWSAPYTVLDYRDTNVIRAGDFPMLREVNQTGEIESGSFSESAEKVRVKSNAIMLTLSRQMLVNDQLQAIEQVLSSGAAMVRTWENRKMYELLLSAAGAGPTLLSDAVAVFHTSHGNIAGSGTVIDVTNIGLARAAMAKQKTIDGMEAGWTPVYLLVGPDKQTQAEQLLASITPATNATAVPESLRKLTPIMDPNITGNAWFLVADPSVIANFVYAKLEGFEAPRMSSEELFGVQGMRVKCEHDFGGAAIDYRAMYRNAGA